MKKLIIFPGNFLPNVGGLETHVDEFSKYLSENKNYQITIFSPNVHDSKETEIIHNNVKVIRYPAFFLISNFPVGKFWSFKFWKMYSNLYSIKYDIVMTRTRFFTNSFLGLIFSKVRFSKLKLIHVEHGSDFVKVDSKFTNFLSYLYDQLFGRLIFRFADKVIGVSIVAKKFVEKNFKTKLDVGVIRRGIDNSYIDSIEKDKIIKKKYENKTIILFIGRLYKWKGVSNTIKAYKDLPEELKKNSVFLIGGYGEDLERLKEEAKSEKNIIFLGRVPFGKNYSLMKSSDIYIHSSYSGGGLSSTLMQFMYCKNAIIASPHEGANEIVNGASGILLEDNSHEEIHYHLKKLLVNKNKIIELKEMSHNYIRKKLSWKKSVQEYIKIFEEI